MSDGPTLVHIEVDAPPEQVHEWTKLVQNKPLDGYEFIVTDGDGTVRSVVKREELVEDIANAVVKQLEDQE